MLDRRVKVRHSDLSACCLQGLPSCYAEKNVRTRLCSRLHTIPTMHPGKSDGAGEASSGAAPASGGIVG